MEHQLILEEKVSLQCERVLDELPHFARKFIYGIVNQTTPLTRLNYATDLRQFFTWICEMAEDGELRDAIELGLEPEDIAKLDEFDIEMFLEWTSNPLNNERNWRSGLPGKARKLATLRSFFKYMYKKKMISHNIMPNVDMPKQREKEIVRLESAEVKRMLISALSPPTSMSLRQRVFHEKNKDRDFTILLFFLTTGVRVSELVGLDYSDLDLENKCFRVTRKGGKREILYMPNELFDQLREFCNIGSKRLNENQPLFVSSQNKRISVRAVQNLVKKYAGLAVPLKNISPHKLRSTFGTNLYRETGDIYVVADVLGHRDVNTTKKHYAAMSDEVRKAAAKSVKVFEEND